jgi:hypothetical protein
LHRCILGWLALLSWPVLILSPPYGVVFVGHVLFQKPVRMLKLLQSMLMALIWIWVWSWISILFVSVYNAKYSPNTMEVVLMLGEISAPSSWKNELIVGLFWKWNWMFIDWEHYLNIYYAVCLLSGD